MKVVEYMWPGEVAKRVHAAISLFFLLPIIVLAQESSVDSGVPTGGVQISPLRFEQALRPGSEWRGSFQLKNFDREAQRITISAENFVVTDDTERITFYPSDRSNHLKVPDIADWVVLPQRYITLAPGEARQVPFIVRVPHDAPTGGYYGAIFATITAEQSTGASSQIGINTRMGTLLIFAVRGEEPARVEGAAEVFAPLRKVFFFSPARFTVAIRNSGNIHFRGAGTVTLSRGGKTIATLPLPSHVNYPGKTRTYRPVWHFGLLHAGPYTAVMRYESLSGLVQLEKVTTIWILPWTLFALLLGIALIFAGIVHHVRTRYTIVRKR